MRPDPRVAARSKWSRIEALLRSKAFRDTYAGAREAFSAGITEALFPAGTYWLRRFAPRSVRTVPVAELTAD